mmetsp:Transcript_13985/g.30903  ORF Transcript_13985/g.30903 Transcript_13985/m.30903 type:complete len:180 (-) Transcript_13985:1961-2500(-)
MDGLLEDDENPAWAVNEEDDDSKPEWLETDVDSKSVDPDTSFLMLRMSAFFLSTVQPKLELFVHENAGHFKAESLTRGETKAGESYTIAQYSMYESYGSIFDDCMEEFTTEYDKTEIVEAIKRAEASAADGKESMETLMLDLLSAVSSFENFHAMMEEASDLSGSPGEFKQNNDSKGHK